MLSRRKELYALQTAAFFTLLGWATIHLFWDVPYRTFLWSETLSSGWVHEFLGMKWNDYVTHPSTDSAIQLFTRLMGVILLMSSIAAVFLPLVRKVLLLISTVILGIVSLMLLKESGYQLAMLIEQASQVLAPALFIAAAYRMIDRRKLLFAIKVAIALTFFGHGLYAIGYHPVPGNFIDMTMSILGLSEPEARFVLKCAGVVDIAIAVLIFGPSTARAALVYASVWGMLTAFARPAHVLALGSGVESLIYWTAQALCRIPHSVLPAAAWLMVLAGVSHSPINKGELGSLGRRIFSRNFRTTDERLSSNISSV